MSATVSVIVPLYNRAARVITALASLRAQTCENFEIIVVDDGSTDGSAEVVDRIGDARIRIVTHRKNRGIPAARNTGLAAARGLYIAWLDSDDIARPVRLATQLAFLEANPAIAMVGSAAGVIRAGPLRRTFTRKPPQTHEEIAATLLFRSAFQQSAIMGRAEILKAYPYRPEFAVCEDLDMFIRLTRHHRVANLPNVLIDRVLHPGQTVRQKAELIVERKKWLFGEILERLGIHASDEELERHVLLGNIKWTPVDQAFLEWSKQWLARIRHANRHARIYDPDALAAISHRLHLKAQRNASAAHRCCVALARQLAAF